MKPVCLILGAGAGIGGHVGKRFAKADYHAALCRRSDEAGLQKLVGEITAAGGEASGHLLNAVDENSIEQLVATIERDIGPIEVAVFNLGAQIGNRSLTETTLKQFELGWQMAVLAPFRLARALLPLMAERGSGTFLVTSATAAMRGNKGQHSHAAAMGGRRLLCQTLNAEYGPKNIHVAHIVVDGAVDAPDTLGKMLGAKTFAKMRETLGAADKMLKPAEMAETYFHVAGQHRSCWTHELDLRPYSDTPWWNS